jgi:hypothetical protein
MYMEINLLYSAGLHMHGMCLASLLGFYLFTR